MSNGKLRQFDRDLFHFQRKRGRRGVRAWAHQNETAEAGFELGTSQSRDDLSTITLLHLDC